MRFPFNFSGSMFLIRKCTQPSTGWRASSAIRLDARYYDFNVWSEEKRVEKLRYIHRNPVKRGLVERPEDWLWSSFHHYLTGEEGVVEIESHWTATRREAQGIYPIVRLRDPSLRAPPFASR